MPQKKRCPNGTRKNKETGNCEPISALGQKQHMKTRKRCPNGMRRNKETGICEPIVSQKKIPSSRPRRRNAKETSVIKVSNSMYTNINIQPGDFFTDPCFVLDKILRSVNDGNVHLIATYFLNDVIKLIPKLNYERKNVYKYGEDILQLHNTLTEGANGIVCRAVYRNRNIIVKKMKPHVNANEFLKECLVHNIMFCKFRGGWGVGARIPKIEFFGALERPSSNSHSLEYVIGMENIDDDGFGFLSTQPSYKDISDMIRSVCILVETLQSEFRFMHRDLHLGNILYKSDHNGKTRKWYILDFGMSIIDIKGKPFGNTNVYPYKKKHAFNPSHDIRMLILSMLSTVPLSRKQVKLPILISMLLSHYAHSLNRYIHTNDDPLFHAGYDTVVQFTDENFTPSTILLHLDTIRNMKTNRTPLNLINAFIPTMLSYYDIISLKKDKDRYKLRQVVNVLENQLASYIT
jgi:hypothetical protein